MSDDQDLAYRRMIDCSWEIGPLPAEPERIAPLIRFDIDRFLRAWIYPLTECWKKRRWGLINPRLERERKGLADFLKSQSEKGRESGKARKAKKAEHDNAQPRFNRGSTGVEPSSNPPSPIDLNLKAVANTERIAMLERGSLASASARKDPRAAGITWNRERDEILLTDDAKRYIAEELQSHSQELDKLDSGGQHDVMLERVEIREGLRNCAVNLVKNRAKTGPKTLPALVVNWLKTDLTTKRKYARSRAPTASERKERSDEEFRKAMRKALEEEHGDKGRGPGDSGAVEALVPSDSGGEG